ncbi:egg cell-secreted protein 1.4 [Sorghum bicolor]|uniref:Prolamin-like domain-containing protein n=1 Tax=Sorghum bicolor TaxID=4558 RepID=C5YSL3_SORBI|nr:egg cell-secreted protein 1.4 [Sorghum bicolor]EES16714.1 hypothetical protein SORBI_3008G049300 [Sorghum bicolor]|eukprot:XP_002442876.1 egg cell-secreted protein 1.4 [Sorghum bicolor]
MAMEAAAPRPRLTLTAAVVVALIAALLVLTHGVGAVTPPRAIGVARRPWVARLQALHDLSTTTSLDGAGEEQGAGEQQQGGFAECWAAVMGLSSCYSEILLFFVNGESYIGPECCVAIRGATRYCWPAMLASVGFTAEEADVLRGFCDGEEAAHHLGSPPPVPAPGRPGSQQADVRE